MSITRAMWYRNPEVIFNIITVSKDRETAFLSKSSDVAPFRNIMANYMKFLTDNFEALHFYERDYNLYYSLARYKSIQRFSFNPVVRKEQRLEWNKIAINNTASYDFGLDFDSDGIESIKDAWVDADKVKSLFDEYGVPYTTKFSGSKGFHITIPYTELPDLMITDNIDEPLSLFNFLKDVALLLDLKLDLPTIDMGIFDPRRIWKTDYSWVVETGLIALPLSDEQFDNFSLSMVEPVNVLKSGIRNRGNLMREGVKGGFRRLIEEGLGMQWKELNNNDD